MSACKSAREVMASLSRSQRESLEQCVWVRHMQAFRTYPEKIEVLKKEPQNIRAREGETYLCLSRDDASGFERGRISLPLAKRLAKYWIEG
jgi:hypothetical protein